MTALDEIIEIESSELEAYFRKATISGSGTPQEVSDRREDYFNSFIQRYFPYPQVVTKGQAIGSDGSKSQSIDCLILSPSHPKLVDANGRYSLTLAEGIDAAVEVKPDISKREELRRGLRQGISLKRVKRERAGVMKLSFSGGEIRKDFHHTIPFSIYADTGPADYLKLASEIVAFYEKEGTPRLHQFDVIVVNKRALIVNAAPQSYTSFGEMRGLRIFETNESLAAFLFLLIGFPKSEMQLSQSVIQPYLNWRWERSTYSEELDRRLIALG